MSTSHRAGGGSHPPGYPQRRPPSPNPLATWGRLGIGSFLGGLVAVIAAVIIHDHAAYPNMVCNTGLGELGQAFSSTVQVDCGVATTAESTVGWLVFFGVAGIIIGLGKMGLGLAGGSLPSIQALGLKQPAPQARQAPQPPQPPQGAQAAQAAPAAYGAPAQAPYGYPSPAAQAPYGYPSPAAQAPYGYPSPAAQGPYGYASPAAPAAAQPPVTPPAASRGPGGPAMPERPAAWAPPPPPPGPLGPLSPADPAGGANGATESKGANWSRGSGGPLWPEPDQYGR
jgi:hypothetical protein